MSKERDDLFERFGKAFQNATYPFQAMDGWYNQQWMNEYAKKRQYNRVIDDYDWGARYKYEDKYPDMVESTATKVSSHNWTHQDDVELVCKLMGLPSHMFEEKVKTPPLFEIVDAEWSEIDE